MKDNIETVLYPINLSGNKYLKIKKDFLEHEGFSVKSLFEVVFHLWTVKIINFNFFDTIHSTNILSCYFKYCGKLLLIKWIKLWHVKIVYTMHNKIGHDTKMPWMDKSLIKFMCKNADRIVVLCKESKEVLRREFGKENYEKIENKVNIIPHMNYVGEYQENNRDFRKELEISDSEMMFLFVGAIRPYKNIELILKVAKEVRNLKVKFVIAGSGQREYLEELKIKTNDIGNVIYIPRFIEDNELAALLHASNILLMPYNKKSSLNSGTCFLAISYHKNVICPKIGTVLDFPSHLVYSYDYQTDYDHYQELYNTVLMAYQDFHENRSEFDRRINELHHIAITKHSVEAIAKKYKELYLEIIRNK